MAVSQISSSFGALATSDEECALARAVIYNYLSIAYRYPTEAHHQALKELDEGLRESLYVLSDGADDPAAKWCSELTELAASSSLEDLEANHVILFSHSPHGTCPLYEGEYAESEEGLQQPHELGDLAAFYRAFGLEMADKSRQRVDFIAVECEYLSFLCHKQAYAEEHEDMKLAELSLDAQKKFLQDHLGRWAPAFARQVVRKADQGFYQVLAHFTSAHVTADCQRLGVQPRSNQLRVRLAEKPLDSCFNCPSAEDCADGSLFSPNESLER